MNALIYACVFIAGVVIGIYLAPVKRSSDAPPTMKLSDYLLEPKKICSQICK
jgi:hypothetical protein